MVRDRAGRAARHRLLERPQAPLCLGSQTAPSHPTSSRYRSNTKSRIDLADTPLSGLMSLILREHKSARNRGAEREPHPHELESAASALSVTGRSGRTTLLLISSLTHELSLVLPKYRSPWKW